MCDEINGTAAHCLVFDDNLHPARTHASAVLVLACWPSHQRTVRFRGDQVVRAPSVLMGILSQ